MGSAAGSRRCGLRGLSGSVCGLGSGGGGLAGGLGSVRGCISSATGGLCRLGAGATIGLRTTLSRFFGSSGSSLRRLGGSLSGLRSPIGGFVCFGVVGGAGAQ